jgi:hypothetical protein
VHDRHEGQHHDAHADGRQRSDRGDIVGARRDDGLRQHW